MEVGFKMTKGKVSDGRQKMADAISSLDDGNYVMTLTQINPLLIERDYQNAYFAMVDTCVQHTGNRRYVIHEAFKKEKNIESTANLSIVEWKKVLKEFQWWAHDKMDVIV